MRLLFAIIRETQGTLTLAPDEHSDQPFLALLVWKNPEGGVGREAGRGDSPELALEALEASLIDRFG